MTNEIKLTERLQQLLDEHEISLIDSSNRDVTNDLAKGVHELTEAMYSEIEMMIRDCKDNILQMESYKEQFEIMDEYNFADAYKHAIKVFGDIEKRIKHLFKSGLIDERQEHK